MPTHLHCLLPRGSSAVPPAGIRAVDVDVALAWVSDTDQARLSRDARDAVRATVAHDRVIGQALAQGVTPLPASLADPYDGDSALQVDVAAHAGSLPPAFMTIAGMVEMTIIIAMRDATPRADAPGRGKAYLEQIRSAPTRVAAVAERIADSLKDFVDERRRPAGERIALSHLVPRQEIDGYRTRALSFASDEYRLIVDGPRAPYSFALFSPRKGLENKTQPGGTILAT
jgi:hypothetical protein